MKVKELIEQLKKFDPEDTIVLSRDQEGNGYMKAKDIEEAIFCDAEIYIKELTPELEKQGYGQEDLYHGSDGVNAVVIWP